ncbi:coiled-coil domain-containing protein 137 [Electrophorus electricus]|uniref:coiled-coil domain-containing protein 137 n=1 Tax=Electrophorus electricus TaxID=8005 RepID=UPI000F0A5848|nr:coiled-coil domain-containing protein 137 [Electrophorus electricus]
MGKKTQNKAFESSDAQKKEIIKSKKKLKKHARPGAEEHLEHIPFRLREIMKSKEKMKMGSRKLKRMMRAAKSTQEEPAHDLDDIPVPHFRRGKKETVPAYLHRMERETQHVLFLTKNQRERQPELQLQENETKSKHKSEKKKKFDQGRLQRLQKKKLEKREERAEKEMFVDEIQFGEVAMAPPSLTTKPKKAAEKLQGASTGLLLSSMLGHSVVSTSKPSMARQRMMEEERERVVQAYRHLKMQKQEQQERQKTGLNRLRHPQ